MTTKEGLQRTTRYGTVLINENNVLVAAARAAYLYNDGILNFTPGRSFALSFKNATLDEKDIALRLKQIGKKFQGTIVHGSMWMCNRDPQMNLTVDDIIASLQ